MNEDPERADVLPVDLGRLQRERGPGRPVWSQRTDDFDLNLVVLGPGDSVEEHVNTEVDVLLVGIEGEGRIAVDGRDVPLRAGVALVVPKGARRSVCARDHNFSYLSCHRRRARLWPSNLPRH